MKDLLKIIRYSWSLKRYYLSIAGFVVVLSVLNQATPFLLKFIVDGLSGGHADLGKIWLWLGLIGGIQVAIAVLSNVQGYLGDMMGAKLNTLLSQRYYDHVLRLPIGYFDNEIAGRITSRLERSIVGISQFMNAFSNNFVGMIFTVILTMGILVFYAWPVALMLAVIFPLYIWMTALSSKAWQAVQKDINADTDVSNGRFVESMGQIRVVKSYVQEMTESLFWAGKRSAIEGNVGRQSTRWHWYDVVRRVALALAMFGIYSYIALMTAAGHYTLGDFTLLIQLVITAQFPLFASSFIVDNIQRAVAGSRDFFEVMDKPALEAADGHPKLAVKAGRVEFSNVNFEYEEGHPVLTGISFGIEPGTKLALVGESGQGKSTIANLMLRFYDVNAGAVSVDGQNITAVDRASLRENIGVVFQDPSLFSGTVRENIAYGRPTATDAEVLEAARAANALDFIEALPDGLATQIGERGVKLSGGQKQRVAIARAILKNAPILILDEATSALDSKAEHEVQAALEVLMRGRTTLIIAHRLSTISSVDKIVGLSGGRVVEQGSPAELANAGGIYAELLELQNPTKANIEKLKKFEIFVPQKDEA